MATETGPKVLAGKSPGVGVPCLPCPPPPGSGSTLPVRINEPCGCSGPGFTVAAPGHPSPPLRSSAPNSPGRATVSARLGAQKRFGAEAVSSRSKRVSVGSGWAAGASTPFHQQPGASCASCAAVATAAASVRPLVTLGGDRLKRAEEEEEEQGGWGWGEKVAIVLGGV